MLSPVADSSEAPPTRINYRAWLVRVIAWDGVLPLLLWLSPFLVRLLVPGINKDAGVLLAVPLPICVFFIRIWFGARHIDANRCEKFRVIQYYCFLFAILVLLFVDALLLALHGELDENWAAYLSLLRDLSIPFAVYLALMAVAMYPGREPIPSTQLGNWEIEC
jgi:hypothetical protein